MKKYRFLLKPFFFILNLLFATWVVFAIDNLSPSDFRKEASRDTAGNIRNSLKDKKMYFKNLCTDYKTGKIDSARLDRQLSVFFDSLCACKRY